MKDGINGAEGEILKLQTKASKIVSYVRNLTHATDILEGKINVQAANGMQSNLQVFIISSLLRVSKEKLDILETVQ